MQYISEPVQRLLDDSFEAFTKGSVDDAVAMLDAARREEKGTAELHDVFVVSCMRASIAAMCGERSLEGYMADASASPLSRPVLLYLEGVAAMTSGTSLQTASMKFEEALRVDKHFILARMGLAAVCFYMKDYKRSFSHYRAVLETVGSSAPGIVRVGLGLCAYRLGRMDAAVKWLERALAVNGEDVAALLSLLVVYLAQRRIKEVIDVVRRLRKVFPDNAMILLKTTDILYFRAVSQGRVKALAPSILHLLSEARPTARVEDAAIADYQEGRLLLALGDFTRARVLLESSMQVLPNCLAARVHYARLLFLLGRDVEAEQLLLRINAEHPNQKEVLQMLAAHASHLGLHERALECSKLLTESVAPGDVLSWTLAAWCSRLNSEESAKLLTHVLHIYEELGTPVPMKLRANKASMCGDIGTLQKILESELGEDFLSKPELPVNYVPIVYNMARLLETSDKVRACELYSYLVKHHPCFSYPYFRLYELAKAERCWRKAIMWMNLLRQAIPDEPRALVYICLLFFEQRRYAAAMNILRLAKTRSCVVALALGQIYLRHAQQHSGDSYRFLELAKDRFHFALQKDKGNVLAAHGMACCLGLEGRHESCLLLLDRVGEIVPNCSYVRKHYEAHMANAKILSDSFKQAIDYLQRDPQRAPLQSSSLAFCLFCEGRYADAIAVQKKAVDELPSEPLLRFNLALLYCASFVASISQKQEQSVQEAKELRSFLTEGLNIAHEFIKIESESRRLSEAKKLLKQLCAYCVHHNDLSIPKVVANGHRAALEAERQDAEWCRVYNEHLEQKRMLEERRLADERQRREQEQQVAGEILEDFKELHGHRVPQVKNENEGFAESPAPWFSTSVPQDLVQGELRSMEDDDAVLFSGDNFAGGVSGAGEDKSDTANDGNI